MAQETQSVLKKLQEQLAKYNYVVKRPSLSSRLSANTGCAAIRKLWHTINGSCMPVSFGAATQPVW